MTDTTPTAVVTGASRGLGATVADYLSGAGHDLVLVARGREALESTADSLPGNGRVIAVAADVTDADGRRRIADAAAELAPVTALVNNASALGPSPLPKVDALDPDDFRRVLDTNVVAPVALVRALDHRLAPDALVVNVSSDAAVEAYPGWGAYGSSKAALDHITRVLAVERDDLHPVSVDPGDMRTDMHQRAFPGEDIGDRPTPDVTVPFWAWLFGRSPETVRGRRLRAQGDDWLETEAV
ncbi:SDR family NAD(P)-dependent oxidoreductase [Haladaptatus salinisoli]|uniref:SDR family NAD(P)-dependent oxidoreductase n=1 Tax=Haladaptatus salinisoli TaxID=2884876 RepID=UPI001D0B10CE|nr:SDR family oxidoreductase [Haladaptatus salinisoli]